MSRLLKTCLIQYLFLDEIYSHLRSPPRKLERLSSVRLPIFKAYSGIVSHIEENYPVPGLHVDSAKKERKAQLNCLSRKEKLREMMVGRNYFAAYTVFSFAATFVDRSLGLGESFDLTRINVLYNEMVKNVLFSHRGGARVDGPLVRLR